VFPLRASPGETSAGALGIGTLDRGMVIGLVAADP
jgi:hypothetical protein